MGMNSILANTLRCKKFTHLAAKVTQTCNQLLNLCHYCLQNINFQIPQTKLTTQI